MLTDEELATVQALRHGGVNAFTRFFDAQRDSLKRFIRVRIDRRLLRRLDDSDIIQEAYFESCRRILGYLDEPLIPPTAWLRRLVRQVLARLKREHLETKCRDVRRETYQSTLAQVDIGELSAVLSSPQSKLQRAEMQEKLGNIIESMAPIEREILILVHFEERSVREAAAELGISLEAAKKRYRRALLRLRELSDPLVNAPAKSSV